ncbi:uncharacterized protein EAF02_007240 [Botrytis sinoallii]|uniref:uncharacterized protein n=1 Tax=Botrytis sinoallii TaxID=1463999 RepID=UPI00190227CF|nr:uncharacterized protein EAF02_007240 [Botrytis sinoallii]KAF7880394.1 hypothetical protein EAF02_007240 [Botrytis sinoallii]
MVGDDDHACFLPSLACSIAGWSCGCFIISYRSLEGSSFNPSKNWKHGFSPKNTVPTFPSPWTLHIYLVCDYLHCCGKPLIHK